MGRGKHILVVDDDVDFSGILSNQFRLHEEFVTVEVQSGMEALRIARVESFDAIILDVELPDVYGHEVCRIMRRDGVNCPIIMLTVADSDADTILGLEAGANDYITKPCRIGVLLARLRAQIRQYERHDTAWLTIGPFTFRQADKLLVNDQTKEKINLTDKEVAMLKYFYRARDQVVDRGALLSEVWGYNAAAETHTLETHVYRLRQKIERDPSNAEILVTEPGGYRLLP